MNRRNTMTSSSVMGTLCPAVESDHAEFAYQWLVRGACAQAPLTGQQLSGARCDVMGVYRDWQAATRVHGGRFIRETGGLAALPLPSGKHLGIRAGCQVSGIAPLQELQPCGLLERCCRASALCLKPQLCAGGGAAGAGRYGHGTEPERGGPAPPAADGVAARAGAGAGREGRGGGPGSGPQDAERQPWTGARCRAWPKSRWSGGCWPRETGRLPRPARRCGNWRGAWTALSNGLTGWRTRWGQAVAEVQRVAEEAGGNDTGARARELQRLERRMDRLESAGGVGTGRAAGPQATGPGHRPALIGITASSRRNHDLVFTRDPATDNEDVFGDAWPLVDEWRGLWKDHPDRGRGLRWLEAPARILELELAMLEEHGLTLPPETEPLRGLERNAQLGWRQKALADTRRKLARRRALRRLRRLLTLGLWRR